MKKICTKCHIEKDTNSSLNDDNFKKCWSLENLRPLSSKQNILDGANKVRHLKEAV